MTDLPEVSLLDILKSQRETRFCGEKHDTQPDTPHSEGYIKDSTGAYYSNPHDYVKFETRNGSRIGVIVGDFNGRHTITHPHDDKPHALALHVTDEYRREGIATELLNSFMEATDSDAYVSDCPRSAIPFHMQTDWNTIYLQQLRNRNPATRPPVFELDVTPSPKHSVPVFYGDSDAAATYVNSQTTDNTPPVYIALIKPLEKYALPDAHSTDETTNAYAGYPPERGPCAVIVPYENIPRDSQLHTDLQHITTDLTPLRSTATNTLWRHRDDMLRSCRVTLDTARDIADKTYTVLSTHDTTHLYT